MAIELKRAPWSVGVIGAACLVAGGGYVVWALNAELATLKDRAQTADQHSAFWKEKYDAEVAASKAKPLSTVLAPQPQAYGDSVPKAPGTHGVSSHSVSTSPNPVATNPITIAPAAPPAAAFVNQSGNSTLIMDHVVSFSSRRLLEQSDTSKATGTNALIGIPLSRAKPVLSPQLRNTG